MDSNKNQEGNSFYIKQPYDGSTIFIKIPYNENTFFIEGESKEHSNSPNHKIDNYLDLKGKNYDNKYSSSKIPNSDISINIPYKNNILNTEEMCYPNKNYNYLDKSILFVITLYFVSCLACRNL